MLIKKTINKGAIIYKYISQVLKFKYSLPVKGVI